MPCLLTLAPSFHSEMAFNFLKMSIIRKLVAHDQPVLDRRLLPGGADESADSGRRRRWRTRAPPL